MVRQTLTRFAAAAALAGGLAAGGVHAQSDKISRNDDWPMYNRDLAGTRYSPL